MTKPAFFMSLVIFGETLQEFELSLLPASSHGCPRLFVARLPPSLPRVSWDYFHENIFIFAVFAAKSPLRSPAKATEAGICEPR